MQRGYTLLLPLFAAQAFTLPLLSERAPLQARGIKPRSQGQLSARKKGLPLFLSQQQQISLEKDGKRALPDTPSIMLIGTLWLNTALMGMAGILACCYAGPEFILGDKFEISFNAAWLGIAWAIPWLLLSTAPLEKWFPKKLSFLREVGDHTEIFTALAFGTRFGGPRRWFQVISGSVLLSVSAGIFEEIVFRGTAQRFVEYILTTFFTGVVGFPLNSAFITGCAVIGASSAFGYLHNYTAGYALLATLAGCFFGTVYAVTQNLFVAATTHAIVDLFAFLTCYCSLARANTKRIAFLAQRDFPITNALRLARENFERQAIERGIRRQKKIENQKKVQISTIKIQFNRIRSSFLSKPKSDKATFKNRLASVFIDPPTSPPIPPPAANLPQQTPEQNNKPPPQQSYTTFAEANNFPPSSPPPPRTHPTAGSDDGPDPVPYHEDGLRPQPPPPPPGYPPPPSGPPPVV